MSPGGGGAGAAGTYCHLRMDTIIVNNKIYGGCTLGKMKEKVVRDRGKDLENMSLHTWKQAKKQTEPVGDYTPRIVLTQWRDRRMPCPQGSLVSGFHHNKGAV